tara:strand:- start:4469 stop:4699 length:231 start_codon:yes stop_codon:yes gene_type:complete
MKAKIKEGRSFFCDQYKQKKFALMQEGQTLEILNSIRGSDKYRCAVINPSLKCIDHGGFEGMKVEIYAEEIDMEEK